MIVGIGTDIIQIPRIERILQCHPKLFIKKYFTEREFEKYKNQNLSSQQLASKVAKFFAAKEAFVKALGTGFRFGITLKDIEILSNNLGKPYIKISGKTQTYIEKNIKDYTMLKYHLSLSDDYPNGIAFVIIEKE